MNRIDGYDLARAIAIFGMLVVNFSIAMTSGLEAPPGPDWLRFLTGLLEGRAAAVFVVLAGACQDLQERAAMADKYCPLRPQSL